MKGESFLSAANVEAACVLFHDAYEAAAVEAGWETQERSRKPWAEVPEANKETMRATLRAVLGSDWYAGLHARIAHLEAQVAGLERMNAEKAAVIRRLRMGNHPAGRALREAPVRVSPQPDHLALAEALTERDAEHEGGARA